MNIRVAQRARMGMPNTVLSNGVLNGIVRI